MNSNHCPMGFEPINKKHYAKKEPVRLKRTGS